MQHTRVIVSHYGGPEAVQVIQEECPEPKEFEVRVRILAAGVAMPDIMAREGIHPETPKAPYTPGWDLVGIVDSLGPSTSAFRIGDAVAAMPIHGAYTDHICLPERDLVPVPSGLDPGEGVSLILNYITAYQMMHRFAEARHGQKALIHGASGGVGTALLELGRLDGLEMYGTCSSRNASAVADFGATPIDYRSSDVVAEVKRLTGEGVNIVFDPFGGKHIWNSREALRSGGKVVAYGNTTSLRSDGLGSGRTGRRNRLHGIPVFLLYILGGLLLPGRKRVLPYSIQWLMRWRRKMFRDDLITLFDLLKEQKIKPIVAKRFPLREAREAQELLSKGGVVGKVVLICSDTP